MGLVFWALGLWSVGSRTTHSSRFWVSGLGFVEGRLPQARPGYCPGVRLALCPYQEINMVDAESWREKLLITLDAKTLNLKP